MTGPKLLQQISNVLTLHQYGRDTERVYLQWVRRFVLFHGKRHPKDMGKREVEAFLTHLAVNRGVAPSTQNQALSAILFMYQKVLEMELPWLDSVVRAKPQRRMPVVLSVNEVQRLFLHCRVSTLLPAQVMYGSGLRLMECLRLRIGDLDFSRKTIRVHGGKGGKDRVTVLSDRLAEELEAQILKVTRMHEKDLERGFGRAKLPRSLRLKLGKSTTQLFWQYLFPSERISEDLREPGQVYRWHIHRSSIRKGIRDAARQADINKRVT